MLTILLATVMSFGTGLVECKVTAGNVTWCNATHFTGSTVVRHNGLFRMCKVNIGNVTTCGGSYQGEAPVYSSGKWKSCKIVNGNVTFCGASYTGTVVTQG
jgi:hypothetical protein